MAWPRKANRLVEFIRDELKPDVVTLPNLMFVGIAPLLREKLNVPVICELTGEDMFLDALGDTGGPESSRGDSRQNRLGR